jgi:hypothetical protein
VARAKRNAERRKERIAFYPVLCPELPVTAQIEVGRLIAELKRDLKGPTVSPLPLSPVNW